LPILQDRAKSWRDVLPVHPAAELVPLMSEAELRELAEDIKKNRVLHVPVTVWKSPDGEVLLDGRNRLDTLENALGEPPLVRAKNGRLVVAHCGLRDYVNVLVGDIDPYAYVISANIQRRHLTPEQKRELIAKLLKATPEKSNRQIAETVKANHKTVGSVRTGMEGRGEIPHVAERKDTKGRKQPAKKATPVVEEQRRQARVLKQERALARERTRREREEWQAEISRFAYKLIQIDLQIARELHRVLAGSGGDAMQLMNDLAAGIEIEEAGNEAGNGVDPDRTKIGGAS
jgi:hypothetical protein